MSVHNITVFLFGVLGGYLLSSFYMALLLVKLGYNSIQEIPSNFDDSQENNI